MPTHSRLRVLFVIGTMSGGGAERQVIEILKRLDRTRFEPLLYLAMKQGELLGEVPSDVPIFAFWNESPETWPRRILRWLKLTRLARYVQLARVLHRERIDVVYDRTYLATLDAAGGCWLRPTPRVSCCVVDPEPELILHSRWSRALSWWFARRAYLSASVVLANSEGLRQRVLEYFRLEEDHVKTFYNLLTDARNAEPTGQSDDAKGTTAGYHHEINNEEQTVKSPNGAVPTSVGATEEPFLIVTAGRLHAQKGHRFLLEAIDELVHRRGRSLQLVVMGQGELEAELRNFVQNRRLESNVAFAGFVAEPQTWYRRADLFVLPSLYEGMPNALIEAVACGTPVLATDCPSGPSEILDGGRCGRLVPPGDAMSLADAIAEALDDRDEGRSRAEVARQRVLRLFDPLIGIRRIESLLQQISRREPSVDPS